MFQNVMTSRKPLQDLTIEFVQDGAEIPEDENYTKESKNNSQESVPCLFYNLKDCSKFVGRTLCSHRKTLATFRFILGGSCCQIFN